MQLTDLYYFHAFLNRELFRGKLQPVIFDYADQLQAFEYDGAGPLPIMRTGDNLLEESGDIFILTALLREMTHQYNAERGADDTGSNPLKHNKTYTAAARAHGLANGGRSLQPETLALITEQLQKYATAMR